MSTTWYGRSDAGLHPFDLGPPAAVSLDRLSQRMRGYGHGRGPTVTLAARELGQLAGWAVDLEGRDVRARPEDAPHSSILRWRGDIELLFRSAKYATVMVGTRQLGLIMLDLLVRERVIGGLSAVTRAPDRARYPLTSTARAALERRLRARPWPEAPPLDPWLRLIEADLSDIVGRRPSEDQQISVARRERFRYLRPKQIARERVGAQRLVLSVECFRLGTFSLIVETEPTPQILRLERSTIHHHGGRPTAPMG